MTDGLARLLLCIMHEACMDIRLRERETLFDIKDMNSFAAGYCSGKIASADELLACLEEEGFSP